jgi:hypothetical protein
MEKEIVYTEKYALILSDDEIKQGDYRVNIQRNTIHFVNEEPSYFNQRNDVFKKVIAHRPLSDAPILEGVPLLEKLPQVMEKKKYDYPNTYAFRKGFEEGYNKAKENEQNQLELPTDEEIYELAEKILAVDYLSFTEGAKWIRDRIKGGNNE